MRQWTRNKRIDYIKDSHLRYNFLGLGPEGKRDLNENFLPQIPLHKKGCVCRVLLSNSFSEDPSCYFSANSDGPWYQRPQPSNEKEGLMIFDKSKVPPGQKTTLYWPPSEVLQCRRECESKRRTERSKGNAMRWERQRSGLMSGFIRMKILVD